MTKTTINPGDEAPPHPSDFETAEDYARAALDYDKAHGGIPEGMTPDDVLQMYAEDFDLQFDAEAAETENAEIEAQQNKTRH